MSIDPRLVERRKTVAEDNAKQNVSRLLKFLVGLVSLGAVVWLFFSPWLSVNQVDTSGIATSPAHSILVNNGVSAGTPMFRLNPAATEAALLRNPWIAEATVSRHWPDRVTVDVVERTPLAWTNTATGWTRRSVDGEPLPSESKPDGSMARIEIAEMTEEEIDSGTDMTGALAFVEALPAERREGTVVTRIDGELWATVDGYQVRLGRSVEMEAKALSLDALLREDIPYGSTIVLIAAANPAVMTPQAVLDLAVGQSDEDNESAVDGGADDQDAPSNADESASDDQAGDGEGG